jgi:hypothetical protein
MSSERPMRLHSWTMSDGPGVVVVGPVVLVRDGAAVKVESVPVDREVWCGNSG